MWFGMLLKVDSKRTLTPSRTRKDFANPADTAIVPGPSRMPTPAFPIRPALFGGAWNEFGFQIRPEKFRCGGCQPYQAGE